MKDETPNIDTTGQLVLSLVACTVICNNLLKSIARVVFLPLLLLPCLLWSLWHLVTLNIHAHVNWSHVRKARGTDFRMSHLSKGIYFFLYQVHQAYHARQYHIPLFQ